MYWLYFKKDRKKIFLNKFLRHYRTYLKRDFCEELMPDHLSPVNSRLIGKLQLFADNLGMEYGQFWRMTFHGFARGHGCHWRYLFNQLSHCQFRLYMDDRWKEPRSPFIYGVEWFTAEGYTGHRVQDNYHLWTIQQLHMRYGHNVLYRVQQGIKNGFIPEEFIYSKSKQIKKGRVIYEESNSRTQFHGFPRKRP